MTIARIVFGQRKSRDTRRIVEDAGSGERHAVWPAWNIKIERIVWRPGIERKSADVGSLEEKKGGRCRWAEECGAGRHHRRRPVPGVAEILPAPQPCRILPMSRRREQRHGRRCRQQICAHAARPPCGDPLNADRLALATVRTIQVRGNVFPVARRRFLATVT
jgi:hypothetical protein